MSKIDKSKLLKNSSEDINLDSEMDKKANDSNNNNSTSRESNNNDERSSSETNANVMGTNSSTNNIGINLAVLNELSKVCKLAMNNISYLSSEINNNDLKKELVADYSQYSNILSQVNQHFEEYGEIPDDLPIGNKLIGFCGVKLNTLKNKSTSKICEIMIQGTFMGVVKVQKILNSKLELSQSTIDLLNTFKNFQKQNIDKLSAYL